MPNGQGAKYTMTRKNVITQVVAGIVGFIVGAYCILGALFFGATTHWYWDSVGWYSALALILTPLALVRLVAYKTAPLVSTVKLLVAALILDILLAIFAWIERDDIFSFEATYPWFAAWSVWQFAALLTLVLSLTAKPKVIEHDGE
jgi:hypothetical protein